MVAKIFLKNGNLSKAAQHANIILTIDDKLIYAYFLLADIAHKKSKQQEVESLLLTAQKKNLGNFRQEIIIAKNLLTHYIETKQDEQALTFAKDVIKRYPHNSSALSLLAVTQLSNNKEQEAVKTLSELISQEKKDIKHRLALTKILLNQPGNEIKALDLLNEISAIEPNNRQALLHKTILLTNLGDFIEAIDLVKRIKKLPPHIGVAELLEGNIFVAEKKLDQALKSYQKSNSKWFPLWERERVKRANKMRVFCVEKDSCQQ